MELKKSGWAALGMILCLTDFCGANPTALVKTESSPGKARPKPGTWAPNAPAQAASYTAMQPEENSAPELEVETVIEGELLLKSVGDPVLDLPGQ
jgi:hypothetical protein